MKTTKNKALVALFKAHIRTRDLFIESCRVAFKLGEKDEFNVHLRKGKVIELEMFEQEIEE